MRQRIISGIVIAGLAFGLLALAGCGQGASSSSASSPTSFASVPGSASTLPAEKDEPVIAIIGDGDTMVQVRNETGYDIVGIRIKPVDESEYSAENSFDGFEFPDGDTVLLSFDESDAATNYDVLLLTSKDSKIAVRDIDLVDAEDIVFHFEQGIGFITYTDEKTGESADNRAEALDAELDADTVVSDLETQKG